MMKPGHPINPRILTETLQDLHDYTPRKGPPSPVKHRAAQQTKLHRAKRRKSARKAQKLARKPNR